MFLISDVPLYQRAGRIAQDASCIYGERGIEGERGPRACKVGAHPPRLQEGGSYAGALGRDSETALRCTECPCEPSFFRSCRFFELPT